MISKSELKFLKSLHHKKFRQKHQQFLIEGTRIIEEAISGDCQIVKVWHLSNLDERQQRLIKECEKKNILVSCIINSFTNGFANYNV